MYRRWYKYRHIRWQKENLDTLFICGGLSGPELGMKNNLKIPNEKKLEELFKKNKILPTVSISYLN